MWSIQEMKSRGKQAFKANYWQSVAVAFVMGIFTTGTTVATRNQVPTSTDVTVDATSTLSNEQMFFITSMILGTVAVVGLFAAIAHAFIANPIEVGGRRFFEKNAQDPTASFSLITEGFQDYWRVFVPMLLRDVFVTLWSLLLVIPGIMKAYSYRMVPYIIKDHPELAPMEVLAYSENMMRGHRWQSFVMDLSFLGWILLGLLTLNLGNILWTNPYMSATDAALYQELSKQM